MAETKRSFAEDTSDREIVLTRLFDAPRDLVWQAITSFDHVAHWWGPIGFTTTIEEMDVRPGGVWRQVMHGPDGTDYPSTSVFTEVVKPERLCYRHSGGKKGQPEAHFESTWLFEAQGEKTKVTLRMLFPTAAARDLNEKTYHAIEGGKQTLSRLAGHLPKMSPAAAVPTELTLTRILDAPRELVFKIWTDPKHDRRIPRNRAARAPGLHQQCPSRRQISLRKSQHHHLRRPLRQNQANRPRQGPTHAARSRPVSSRHVDRLEPNVGSPGRLRRDSSTIVVAVEFRGAPSFAPSAKGGAFRPQFRSWNV
jgi:uncharacterized protein YndB with AHSA1/START domain